MDWRTNNGVRIGLLVILLTVWGYNGYQIAGRLGGDAAAPLDIPPVTELPPEFTERRSSTAFLDPVPSPFKPPTFVMYFEEPEETTVQVEPVRPKVRLRGLIGETAILEEESGDVTVVRVGDTLPGFVVSRITRTGVELKVDEQLYWYELDA